MTELDLIRWEGQGAYLVAFSTRLGGVSGTPFDTLNLGRLTEDDPGHVSENRRRLCAEIGADDGLLRFGRQVHGATVRRAEGTGEPGDGLWSDTVGEPLLVFTADCLPVAIVRTDGRAPAVAALHVGWRGLLAGIVAEGVASLGGGPLAAAIGPGIGPCCYEVGGGVAEAFRNRFGPDVVADARLDLWTAAERALRAADVTDVHRTDLCTACNPELFFSHRRDGRRTGRQGMVALVA
jgi:purine-nucleoside/S-methyl-5'-thioadenosine phosphorylase / adenosine deaminase